MPDNETTYSVPYRAEKQTAQAPLAPMMGPKEVGGRVPSWIPEFGGRVLRVAVNTAIEPNRVVSVFFDRQMKGKL